MERCNPSSRAKLSRAIIYVYTSITSITANLPCRDITNETTDLVIRRGSSPEIVIVLRWSNQQSTFLSKVQSWGRKHCQSGMFSGSLVVNLPFGADRVPMVDDSNNNRMGEAIKKDLLMGWGQSDRRRHTTWTLNSPHGEGGHSLSLPSSAHAILTPTSQSFHSTRSTP